MSVIDLISKSIGLDWCGEGTNTFCATHSHFILDPYSSRQVIPLSLPLHRHTTRMSPPYFRRLNLVFILMGLSIHAVLSQSLVEYLPGFPGKLPFKLETGYIGVGKSEEIQLFYYFIESERSPEDDPLLVWLQGGPGCSGLSGLIFEMGPLMFDYDRSDGPIPELVLNPYSWTKVSNIIFLDQPVGTGFSYTNAPGGYETNDTLSAKLTYEFIKKWIISHPKYQKNPLYITGESYCGIVLPLVVDEIYNGIKAGSKPHLNMKGYVLGNPITDMFVDINGRVPYAHRMGLLSDELYQSAKENCNGNYLSDEPNNHLCKNDMERVNQCVEKIYLYYILEPWCEIANAKREQSLKHLMLHSSHEEEIDHVPRILQSVPLHAKSDCPFVNYRVSRKWANVKLVQEALHVREGTITEWLRCNYTLRDEHYTKNVDSTVHYHKKFTNQSGCRALIFSGDHDMGAPHSSTEEWIRSLKLRVKSEWKPWFVKGQVGGYTTVYFTNDSELTYATVKGAGHTVPEYKPKESFFLIDRWLSHNPL